MDLMNILIKKSIIAWLSENTTSPLIRQPMHIDQLRPDRTIQAICSAFRELNSTSKSENA